MNMWTLSPSPWDLPLSRQNGWVGAASAARHSGRWVGARVASLRCPILRPGAALLVHPPASAYIEELSGEPVGLVRGQEDHDIGYVLGRATSAKRSAGGNGSLLVRREPAGLNRTRRHNIDGDAVLADFARCGAAVGLNRVLARGVA